LAFDFQLIEEAAILTGIGMATAFGLLVILMVSTSLTAQITVRVFERRFRERVPTSEELERERRDKALAAVIAVSAILEDPNILEESSVESDEPSVLD
jgi:Na+-transporting methylmalonyl-CoA/oxaloacetate decarboxylase gamma subunit